MVDWYKLGYSVNEFLLQVTFIFLFFMNSFVTIYFLATNGYYEAARISVIMLVLFIMGVLTFSIYKGINKDLGVDFDD